MCICASQIRSTILHFAISLAILCLLELASVNAAPIEMDYVPGELIIRYKDSPFKALGFGASSEASLVVRLESYVDLESQDSASQDSGKKLRSLSSTKNSGLKALIFNQSKTMHLKFKDEGRDLKALANEIKENLNLEEVHPNYLFEATATVEDPLYFEQWGLETINVSQAWDNGYRGEGAVVAVIDTGVDYKHRDLKDRIWRNEGEIPNNKIDDDKNGYVDDIVGYDFVADGVNCALGEDCSKRDANPMDYKGHGTHVAGIIAAESNSIGLVGVAPKSKIMPLRAAFATPSSALLKSSDVYEAINYAIQNKADVINMSFAGSNLGILVDAIENAYSKGIVLVGAAGNSASTDKLYPAALPEVISVGAVDYVGDKASFSNYGDWIDIVAPGVGIYSTLPNNLYGTKKGTSMAAPFVSGVAALIKAKNKIGSLSPSQIKARILNSSHSSQFPTLLAANSFARSLNADVSHPLEVDEISMPKSAMQGEVVIISGAGSQTGSGIAEYEWMSNIDGFLSNQKDFALSNLTVGTHVISLRVQSMQGAWSKKVTRSINISNEVLAANEKNDYSVNIKKRKGKYKAKVGPRNVFVSAYEWTSDLDGVISTSKKLSKKSLSQGVHRVSLRVKDQRGRWSEEAVKIIRVR